MDTATHVSLHRALDAVEAADFISFTVGTLANWRLIGKGPRFIKIGRTVRYRVVDLLEWMEANTRTSTSDPGEAA